MKIFFNSLNTYYWNKIQERSSLTGLLENHQWVDALIHFCSYAFERAGSPVVYRDSAIEALKRNQNWLENRERWTDDIETRIFENFTQVCQENFIDNFNLKNNPLGPSDNAQISMIHFAWYETEDQTITRWAISAIENDDLLGAFNKLKKIRGVGSKIASFYLRDIYILSGNKNRDLKNRYLLQPVDVWTRRAARILMNDQNASDDMCAQFLIKHEDDMGVLNGSLNIAFWVLGSQIAEDEQSFYEFVKALKMEDRDALRRLLSEKISSEKDWFSFLETIHNSL